MRPICIAATRPEGSEKVNFRQIVADDNIKHGVIVMCDNKLGEGTGGTAVIRPFLNKKTPNGCVVKRLRTGRKPGPDGGFQELCKSVREIVDEDMKDIEDTMVAEGLTELYFACSSWDKKLIGTETYAESIADEVVKYVSEELHRVPERVEKRYLQQHRLNWKLWEDAIRDRDIQKSLEDCARKVQDEAGGDESAATNLSDLDSFAESEPGAEISGGITYGRYGGMMTQEEEQLINDPAAAGDLAAAEWYPNGWRGSSESWAEEQHLQGLQSQPTGQRKAKGKGTAATTAAVREREEAERVVDAVREGLWMPRSSSDLDYKELERLEAAQNKLRKEVRLQKRNKASQGSQGDDDFVAQPNVRWFRDRKAQDLAQLSGVSDGVLKAKKKLKKTAAIQMSSPSDNECKRKRKIQVEEEEKIESPLSGKTRSRNSSNKKIANQRRNDDPNRTPSVVKRCLNSVTEEADKEFCEEEDYFQANPHLRPYLVEEDPLVYTNADDIDRVGDLNTEHAWVDMFQEWTKLNPQIEVRQLHADKSTFESYDACKAHGERTRAVSNCIPYNL